MAHEAPDRPHASAIEFSNGQVARVVPAGQGRTVETLLDELDLSEPRPVVIVIGGADALDPGCEPKLGRLLERGLIRAAAATDATIVDGGTDSGVMRAVGRAAAMAGARVPIVGVAPAGRVTWPGDERAEAGTTELEPNHTHFLLATGSTWGDETPLLFDAADALGGGHAAVAVLAGGGDVTLDEVRLVARRSLPTVAISGTGGLADELAAWAAADESGPSDAIADVLDTTDLIVVPLDADPHDFEMALRRLLGADETLAEARRQQALLSTVARHQQRGFRLEQAGLLVLGLLLTFLVVSKAWLDAVGLATLAPAVENALTFVILLLPISIAVLASAATKFRPGGRWILLRAASEALKREIWLYRTRVGPYSHERTRRTPREVKLSAAVGSAIGGLMRTDVNALSFAERPPRRLLRGSAAAHASHGHEDDLALVTPEEYVALRLDEQIAFYRRKVAALERQARWLRWLAWIFGGLGTLLAAIGLQIWVAVTTAVVGIYTTIVEAWQLETSVMLYNQAASDLTAIRTWWNALPPADQKRQSNIDRLVERSEQVILAEHAGWVQEAQDAMTKLRLEEAATDEPEAPDGHGTPATEGPPVEAISGNGARPRSADGTRARSGEPR
jgi:hypothetical protein